jgi:hypothetical protein
MYLLVSDDPHRIPHLLIWKNRRDGNVVEAVCVARTVRTQAFPKPNRIEIRRTDGKSFRFILSSVAAEHQKHPPDHELVYHVDQLRAGFES